MLARMEMLWNLLVKESISMAILEINVKVVTTKAGVVRWPSCTTPGYAAEGAGHPGTPCLVH